MLLGNAKNPPTTKEPMQPEQTLLELGLDKDDRKAWALDVIAVYRYRVSQRGPQAKDGRYGSQEWLEALEVMALGWGRCRALEEVELVASCMREEGADGEHVKSNNEGEARWLEDAGRRAVSDTLDIPDNTPLQPTEGRAE